MSFCPERHTPRMTPLALLRTSRAARAWSVAGLAACSGALAAAAMASGPGLTVDSVRYAAAARAFADTGAVTDLDGGPFTTFPPGLPVVLGTVMRTGLPVESAAAIVNVVAVVAMVVATYWLAALALRATTLALLPAAVVSVATPTVMLHSRLWSEPLFTLVTLLVLIVATRAVLSRSLTPTVAVLLAALCSAAVWIRYIGITLIPVVAMGAAMAARDRGPRRMMAAGAGVGAVAALGAVALVARNLATGSEPFGGRSSRGGDAAEFVLDAIRTLGSYLMPQPIAALALPAGVLVAALLAYGAWRVLAARDAGMSVLLAFIVVYWSTLLAISLLTVIEYTRYRLAAPAFAPLVVLAVYAARDLQHRSRGATRIALSATAAVVLLLALPTALAQSAAYVWVVGRTGHGYGSESAEGSALATAVARLPADARLASNDPTHVYWVAGRLAASYNDALRDPGSVDYLAIFRSIIPGTSRQTDLDPTADDPSVTLVASFEDGSLYKVTRDW